MGINELNLEDIKTPKDFCEKVLGLVWKEDDKGWPPTATTSNSGTLAYKHIFANAMTINMSSLPTIANVNSYDDCCLFIYAHLRDFSNQTFGSDGDRDLRYHNLMRSFSWAANNAVKKMSAGTDKATLSTFIKKLNGWIADLNAARSASTPQKSRAKSPAPATTPAAMPKSKAKPPEGKERMKVKIHYRLNSDRAEDVRTRQVPSTWLIKDLIDNCLAAGEIPPRSTTVTCKIDNTEPDPSTPLVSIPSSKILDIRFQNTKAAPPAGSGELTVLCFLTGDETATDGDHMIFSVNKYANVGTLRLEISQNVPSSVLVKGPRSIKIFKDATSQLALRSAQSLQPILVESPDIIMKAVIPGYEPKETDTSNQDNKQKKESETNGGLGYEAADNISTIKTPNKTRIKMPKPTTTAVDSDDDISTTKTQHKLTRSTATIGSGSKHSDTSRIKQHQKSPRSEPNRDDTAPSANRSRRSQAASGTQSSGTQVYQYNIDAEKKVYTVCLAATAAVKDLKEYLRKKHGSSDIANIKVLFAGKDLLNDIVLKDLNIGNTPLQIYIRSEQDILLMTAKALRIPKTGE